MSTLAEIRTALKTTVEAGVSNFILYERAADVTQAPSGILVLKNGLMEHGFGGNCVKWNFDIVVLAQRNDITLAQAKVDALIDKGAAGSIPRVIEATPMLGLSDVSAHIEKMDEYGKEITAQGVNYLGASLALQVMMTA